MHQLCAGVDKLISLHSTAMSALIHPKEINTPTCDAVCCKYSISREERILTGSSVTDATGGYIPIALGYR